MPSRREFLTHGLGAAASLSGLRRRPAPPAPRRTRLFVVFQRGGADGLSMVVPYADPVYYWRRPTIAVPRPGAAGGAIDLDGFFGFHPGLAPLRPFYARRELAVVHACGSGVATASHLRAQEALDSMLVRLVASNPSVTMTCVDSRGWDDHAEQGGAGGRLARRLDEFARIVEGLARQPVGDAEDRIIVTLSEFGRSLAENRDGGTDHGHGTAMLVIGSTLAGGTVHGRWPGLPEGRHDLPATTGVHDVLAAIVAGSVSLTVRGRSLAATHT